MKKVLKVMGVIAAIVLFCALLYFIAPSSLKRGFKDFKSDWSGGLDRHLTVYTADGQVLAEYDGKIDLESNESGVVKFDFKGKRYMYYNCFVEVIEK